MTFTNAPRFSFTRAASLATLTLVTFAASAIMRTRTVQAAPISYTGAAYGQDFNSLASASQGSDFAWSDGSTLTGWYANTNGSIPTTYKVNNGSSANTNNINSNGSVGGTGTNPDSDRALGTQSNSSSIQRLGVAFSNDTSLVQIGFTATYDGEQWRRINAEGADDYLVDYQIFDAGLGSLTSGGTWTPLPTMTFNAPSVSIGGGTVSLDGNNPSFRVPNLTATISDLDWNPGQELWLRFTDGGTGQHQLAVDNFLFTAQAAPVPVPEPSTFLLLGLGALGLMRQSRKHILLSLSPSSKN